MGRKSAVPILAIATLTLWLVSSPALAATRTTSFGVTATVEAGCQASASYAAAGNSASSQAGRRPAVSVDCTFAVPYRVIVSNSARAGMEAAGSPETDPAYMLAYNESRDPDLLESWGGLFGADSREESEFGSLRPLSSAMLPGYESAPRCVAYAADTETITATIVY